MYKRQFVHYPSLPELRLSEPSFRDKTDEALRKWLKAIRPYARPRLVYHMPYIRSATGATAEGYLIALPMIPEQFMFQGPERVQEWMDEALEIFAPQLVSELIGDAVLPHRSGLPLVRPKDEAVAFLAQVVTGVGIAQQRQWGLAGREFSNFVGDVVLVRHVCNRQVATDQAHHLTGAIAGGVDDDFAFDGVLVAVSGA